MQTRMKNLTFLEILILAFSANFAFATADGNKANKILLLSLMPVNNGITAYPSCLASMRAVIDFANSADNILPGYELVLKLADEGPGAMFAPKNFFRFLNQFRETDEPIGNTFLSPIVLGPTVACQNVALSLKAMGFTAFSELCNGPLLIARKKLYSNLYRFIWPGEYAFPVQLQFMNSVGGWKEIGIMTTSSNPNDVQGALMLQKVTVQGGVDVVHFGIDDGDMSAATFNALKLSRARIIATVFSAVPVCVNFFCKTYQYGVKAPQFLFIFQTNCFFPLNTDKIPLPAGCSWPMIQEQLKITIFAGFYRGTEQVTEKTSFGYDAVSFDQRVDALLGQSNGQSDQELRTICHDITMAAISVLNQSETVLQKRFNSSLKDFDVNKQGLVSTVVRAAASAIDLVGLRTGRMKYSPIMELEEDQMWIAQQKSDGQLDMFYKIQGSSSNNSQMNYSLNLIKPLRWMTNTGKPPKDLSKVEPVVDRCSDAAVAVIVVIALLTTLEQVVQGRWVLVCHLKEVAHFGPYFGICSVAVVFLGCFILNTAAVVLVAGSVYFPEVECRLLHVLTPVGLVLIDSVVFSLLLAYSKILSATVKISRKAGGTYSAPSTAQHSMSNHTSKDRATGNTKNTLKVAPTDFVYVAKTHRSILGTTFAALFVSGLLLLIWLTGQDPVRLEYRRSPVAYDGKSDTYFEIVSGWCTSNYQTFWLMSLIVIHGSLLLLGCFFALQVELLPKPTILKKECRSLKLAIVNASAVFFGALFILVIFTLSGNAVWVMKSALAVGNLVMSLSTNVILFFPFWNISNRPPQPALPAP